MGRPPQPRFIVNGLDPCPVIHAHGLLWIGQGIGLIKWPASSFMIDQRPWVTRGVFVSLLGICLIAASRRRKLRV